MITYVQGGFFTSPAAVLVNTVNTVGVMGKGIAKDFKAIYPEMFEIYQGACERGEFTIGSLLFYRSEHKSVLNFPTKRHWKAMSRLPDIEAGLKTFVERYMEIGISSIAFPQLGCGNGELHWEAQVRPLMERYLDSLPIDIYIHIYDGARDFVEHRDIEAMRAWLRREPRALGFAEVWSDLTELVADGSSVAGWRIEIIEDEALRFHHEDRFIVLARDDVLDLWQQLRTYGLLSRDDVSLAYEPIVDGFFNLLERLPYIDRTEFITLSDLRSGSASSVNEGLQRYTSRGVRLVPWNGEELAGQLDLFERLSVA